jgi:iron complex outermembrane recepter protein
MNFVRKFLLFISISMVLLGSTNVFAKVVNGIVKSSLGEPLVSVTIKVRNTNKSVITNHKGAFSFDLAVGRYTLDIEGGIHNHFHQDIEVIDTNDESNNDVITITLEDEPEHKVVVLANPLEHTALDMATPSLVLSGEELTLKRAGTLGDILKLEPGLSVASFGPAVSRPVIRGLGGSRVQIANNQMLMQDASSTSADHDVGMEPLLAEQVEVIKGPATLLYGSGAIGGIVNTSDRKISREYQDELSGGVEVRLSDSVLNEKSLVFSLDGSQELSQSDDLINWHFDGFSNQSDNIEIPSQAESQALQIEEGETPEVADSAVLENSAVESSGLSLGSTYVADWGYIGAAVSRIEKLYGVPGHGEHEEETAPVEDEHEEGVKVDMQQTRYDLQAMFEQPLGDDHFIDRWFVGYALTDYAHNELEDGAIGTQFNNKAWEFKTYIKHNAWQGWQGVWGTQLVERDFSALGDEAFVAPSLTQTHAIFALEEKEFNDLKWELGLRFESQSVAAENQDKVSHSALSYSSGLVYSLSSHNKLAVNYAHASRFASVEELFSYGPHLTTQSFEIGQADLTKEISNNLDFSYRFEGDNISGEVNLYHNDFKQFIYGQVVTANDACVSAQAAQDAAAESLQLVCYKQQDATFYGAELQIDYSLGQLGDHAFKLGLIADFLNAEFTNKQAVPRIPAQKMGLFLSHDWRDFSSQVSLTHYKKQDKIGSNEIATAGFNMLDLELAYRTNFSQNDWFIFFKGHNLLNHEARDHTSFLKDLAPRAARNFVLGMRVTF